MFEFEPICTIDKLRQIKIRFHYRRNPSMDDNICGVGSYQDERNAIWFDFDSLHFEVRWNEHGSEAQKALVYYIFSDQIYQNYQTRYQKSVCEELEPIKSQDDLITEFREAFEPYVTLGGEVPSWKKSRLIFLSSVGIVRPSSIPHRNPFSYIFVDKIKKRFEIDREALIEENR